MTRLVISAPALQTCPDGARAAVSAVQASFEGVAVIGGVRVPLWSRLMQAFRFDPSDVLWSPSLSSALWRRRQIITVSEPELPALAGWLALARVRRALHVVAGSDMVRAALLARGVAAERISVIVMPNEAPREAVNAYAALFRRFGVSIQMKDARQPPAPRRPVIKIGLNPLPAE